MLFMIVERFKDRDAVPVYRRVRDSGRGFPDGLKYVGSWIEPNFDRCFQLMECDDLRLLQQWLARHKPDAILTFVVSLPDMLRQLGYRLPQDVAVAGTGIDVPVDAGLDQHSEAIGRMAVEMLVSQINLNERGEPAELVSILRAMQKRDRFDSTRELAPLRPAEDAVIVNSDGLNAGQVLERVKALLDVDCG